AEVFLDGVFVPDRDVLGEVNDGWNVAMATASSERGLTLRSPGRFVATAARLVELYRQQGAPADARRRDAVVKGVIEAEAYRLYTLATVAQLGDRGRMGAEASLMKVFWSELDLHLRETALALLAPRAELQWPWM